MKLGDVVENLGLGSLNPDTSGRGQDEEGSDGSGAETDTDNAEAESSAGRADDTAADAESMTGVDTAVVDRIEELDKQIDDLEADVESNESTLQAVRNEREELEERMAEIEDDQATLLGIYDQVAEGINPFAGDRDVEPPDDREFRYGVVTGAEESDAEDADDVVSFEDIKAQQESDETAADSDPAPADGGATPEPEERGPAKAATPEPTEMPTEPTDTGGEEAIDGAYLGSLPSTYATDVLAMQWLAMLLEEAGPSGTLEALDYYQRVEWISPQVQRRLETMFSGAYDGLDADEPAPADAPDEVPPAVHDRSSDHLQRIARQADYAAE